MSEFPVPSGDAPEAYCIHSRMLWERFQAQMLRDLVTGSIAPELLSGEVLSDLHLNADRYQVVLVQPCPPSAPLGEAWIAEVLRGDSGKSANLEFFRQEGRLVILLKGRACVRRFQELASGDSEPMRRVFLTAGRPVDSAQQIARSYREGCKAMEQRFFSPRGKHYLSFEALRSMERSREPIRQEALEAYTTRLAGSLQTFNRRNAEQCLHALEEYLYSVDTAPEQVKILLADFYTSLKGKLTQLYQPLPIPFPSNSQIITQIQHAESLYEIMDYLSAQFDGVLAAIGTGSRNDVLDNILYYIEKNYAEPLKLESIAELFGYNSAYLGKLFTRKVGCNFNAYVDQTRIGKAKELLCTGSWKVYEIAERVGYRNVDYFHKKFRALEGISPAEYRKQSRAGKP